MRHWQVHHGEVSQGTALSGPRRKRRSVWLWVAVVCLLVPVVGFGVLWVGYKKPWLMDDYRAGYDAGLQKYGVVDDPNRAANVCARLMGSAYGIAPRYVQYDTSEPASAYWWGCIRGLSGGSGDWWNVSGYLTA